MNKWVLISLLSTRSFENNRRQFHSTIISFFIIFLHFRLGGVLRDRREWRRELLKLKIKWRAVPSKLCDGSELWIRNSSGWVTAFWMREWSIFFPCVQDQYVSWGILGAKGDVTNFIWSLRDRYHLCKEKKMLYIHKMYVIHHNFKDKG